MKHVLARAAGVVLGGLTAFLVVYVVYAHIAGMALALEYDPKPIEEHFESSVELARRFTKTARGEMTEETSNGALRVRGPAIGQGELQKLEFVGPRRRLGELRARLRVRVPVGAVDVHIGIEADDPSHRSVKAVASNSASGQTYAIWGHLAARSTRDEDGAVLARGTQANPAGSELRTVELRLSPDTSQALLSVDGAPQASRWIGWAAGTPVHFVFGIAAREYGQPFEVEITEVEFEPRIHDTRNLDFVDHLNGRFIDPRRWNVERALPSVADATFDLTPDGLHLTAKARMVTRPEGITTLRTPKMGLGSFRSSMTVTLHEATRGAVFLMVNNLLPDALNHRVAVGVLGDDHGATHGFAIGGWTGDNQLGFRLLGAIQKDRVVRVRLDYDANTRTARGCLDDACGLEAKIDLEPTEIVTFSVVAELNAPNGSLDALVREVTFDRVGDSWQ